MDFIFDDQDTAVICLVGNQLIGGLKLDVVGTPLGTMQSLLGHSTPEITREIYLHAIPEEQRRAVESVERLVFGPKWTQVQAPPQTTSGRVN